MKAIEAPMNDALPGELEPGDVIRYRHVRYEVLGAKRGRYSTWDVRVRRLEAEVLNIDYVDRVQREEQQ